MADDIDLRSVNWSQGMFLTPDHFLRQERYTDSLFLWLVRHLSPAAGLIGGGARAASDERGAARFDPIVEVDDNGDTLNLSVTQCRGITRSGLFVEVDSTAPVRASIAKRTLEGVADVGVYVVAHAHDKEPDDRLKDPINPTLSIGRRARYTLQVEVRADEADRSLLLTRLEREPASPRFQRRAGFIPACVFMSSHSTLMDAFRRMNDSVGVLADRYGALHRAIVDFLAIARARGLNVQQDEETLAFVSHMVTTLEACAYELLDPLVAPPVYFRQMTRLIRSSALFLSLSPPTREYFKYLGEVGESEFVSLLEDDGKALSWARSWTAHEDLSVEAAAVLQALERLGRLEQALEGRYMDFRVSPTLENINFVFDRTSGEPVLYKAVAKPARPQAHGQELTFVFAPLRLEARESYRLILVGERNAAFQSGDRLSVELRINPGEGYSHPQEFKTTEWELDGHRNFAVDFKAPPDLVSINDLRASLRSTQPIRSAILYVRSRLRPDITPGYAPAPVRVARPSEPLRPQPPAGSPPSVRQPEGAQTLRRGGRLRPIDGDQ